MEVGRLSYQCACGAWRWRDRAEALGEDSCNRCGRPFTSTTVEFIHGPPRARRMGINIRDGRTFLRATQKGRAQVAKGAPGRLPQVEPQEGQGNSSVKYDEAMAARERMRAQRRPTDTSSTRRKPRRTQYSEPDPSSRWRRGCSGRALRRRRRPPRRWRWPRRRPTPRRRPPSGRPHCVRIGVRTSMQSLGGPQNRDPAGPARGDWGRAGATGCRKSACRGETFHAGRANREAGE